MQVLPTTLCIMVGQVRVVMAVIIISDHFPFLPIRIRTKESKLQPSTTETGVASKRTLRAIKL